MSEPVHERFMRRAIELATKVPALPFGAVIVNARDATIVAEGWNRSSINPTWHGEINAINRWAQATPANRDGTHLALYTTAEPCPMCQSAILWSGIGTVVFGTSIRFLQSHGWRQIDLQADEVIRRSPFAHCTLVGGILEEQCNALFVAALKSSNGR